MSDIPAAAARAAPEPTAAPGVQPPVVVAEPRAPSGDGLVVGAWDSAQPDDLCGQSLDALLVEGEPVAFVADAGFAAAAMDAGVTGVMGPAASPELSHDRLVRPVTVADAVLLVEVDPSKPAS
jgi:hypothetical protein